MQRGEHSVFQAVSFVRVCVCVCVLVCVCVCVRGPVVVGFLIAVLVLAFGVSRGCST